ncbi:MAG TPA: nitrilase-related carbon-nitrogen hydrolase [Alphaproteobacteria bacterium]|nr:nitrilase-related carbon-nitrogen hydrolase [Alphaproteobacteria bacterium]
MTIKPWRATSIQTLSRLAVKAPDRAGAWSIIDANISHAIALIERALSSETPPDLVVLPEFAFQGPPHGMPAADWIERACCPIPGPITERFQTLARARGIYIGAHQFDTDPDWPGRYFNTSFLIAPSGEVILRYRRINTAAFPSPHDLMDAYVERYGFANLFPVVDTELGRLAMIPCGEINVPEVARVLMMQGAEVILHPTNSARRPAQEAAKMVRAAENMVFIVSANVAGGIGFSLDGSVPGGRSQILDYLGRTLAYEDGAEETLGVSATIDIEALRAARKKDTGTANPLLRARWEMYRPFFNAASFYPPNSFLESPMSTPDAAKPALAASLSNMAKAGIIVE